MSTQSQAARRKQEWGEMPEECFEVLAFRDLQVGDRFISLPLPGDNHGHGGFKGTTYIFRKIENVQQEQGQRVNAIREVDAILTSNPDSMAVLRVK